MPMPFGYGVSIVLSGSMEPAISVNDLVIVKETKEIEVGDVIVYQSGRDLIIHRVISKNGDLIVTQGDANQVADVPITMADVKGKMIGSIPAVGMAVKCLKSPLVMIGLLLIAFYMMEHSFRLDREQDEEEMQELRDEIAYLKQKKKLQTYRHHRKNRED
jgi:signal peptidase